MKIKGRQIFQDTDEEESPGWGNSPSVLRPSQDQRDGEQDRGGAYYEIFKESSASYNAGLLAGRVVHEEEHLESKGPDQGAHTPQIDREGPLEGGGPETGFPTPSVGGGGPLIKREVLPSMSLQMGWRKKWEE